MQPVLVPCRRFDVEVSLGGDEGLGIVDQFVLRTIVQGAHTVDVLAKQLRLPERMAFDAMLSLLGAGWLTVEDRGKIGVASQVRDAMGDPDHPSEGWSKPFAPRQPAALRSVTLTQDLVSGTVFVMGRATVSERERLPQMPRGRDLPEPDEIPVATLIPVVVAALRDAQRHPSGARSDLMGVPPGLRITMLRVRRIGVAVSTRPLLVQTMVTALTDPDGPIAQVRVVGPDRLPPRVRASIASALNRMHASGLGRASFFDKLKLQDGKDEMQDGFIHPPGELFAEIETHIPAFEVAGPADHADVHELLRRADDDASPVFEHLGAHETTSSFVIGRASRFQERAMAAIDSARHQVVLACPWISRLNDDPRWKIAISKALERGVSVILIWGIDDSEAGPGTREWRVIEELQARKNSGSVIVAKRGAANHAKLVVRDVDQMLVSSCNFLNAVPTSTTTEAGILISSRSDRGAALPILEALRWLTRTIPDVTIRSRILVDSIHFGSTDYLGSLRTGPPQVELPVFSPTSSPFAMLGPAVWRSAWRKRLEWLRGACSVAELGVLMVTDAEHRDLLVNAIATARTRLGIASHSVRVHGLSLRIQALLLQAMERGVDVRVVTGRTDERTTDAEAQDRLQHLASNGVSVRVIDNHAKVIVCDDWLTVSSFNFLGQDPSPRSAHEFGLRVFDRTEVTSAWRDLFEAV